MGVVRLTGPRYASSRESQMAAQSKQRRRIALINALPNREHSAEAEFISRFRRVAESLGHEVFVAVTSDEIEAADPDFVIATHEFAQKLTFYPTILALWSPPVFFETDKFRLQSILSHDAYLVGSPQVAMFLKELEAISGAAKPKSAFRFLPSSPARMVPVDHARSIWELVYIGIHWDGRRHQSLLDELEKLCGINLYGPAGSWKHAAFLSRPDCLRWTDPLRRACPPRHSALP